MSVCNPCAVAGDFLACTTDLKLPNIGSFNTDVLLYQKDCTTGRIVVAEATSGAAGEITYPSSDFIWMPNHKYELWVTKNTASALCDKETFTICETTATCISVSAISAFVSTGGTIAPNVQVLSFEDCCPDDQETPVYITLPDGGGGDLGGGDAPPVDVVT